ncbi:MAG TPA: hypothetical protein V6D10_19470 [Trichocoleus sp.]
MNEINIVQAWTLWLSGHLSSHATIWGVSIFWWGRLGKMMQFVGAITIIADIIGPEKIRRFGTSLQSAITPTSLIQFLKDCFDWYTIIFQRTLMKDYSSEPVVAKEKNHHLQLNILNYVICSLLTLLIIALIKLQQVGWTLFLEAAIIFGCLLVSVSPLITVLTILTFTLTGIFINTAFVKPLAWVLEHPSLDRSTKIVSFLFLLFGFHFELLAS